MAKMYFPQYARGRDGIDLVVGESILQHIRRIGGVEIDSECGGQGTCGKDVIRVDQGPECLSPLSPTEKAFVDKGQLKANQRLACQAIVDEAAHDIRIFIPDFGRYTILTESVETPVDLNPAVFRKGDRVLYHTGEDLGRYQGGILGLAIDVGTTTIVLQLVDLETGENVGKPMASKNPQIAYGNDVISRTGYTMEHEDGLRELKEAVIDGVNQTVHALAQQLEGQRANVARDIYDVVVVGNSTMRSIFFGQNVHDLGLIPFEPASNSALTRKAHPLGLEVHREAMVYGPSLIGGHAGADCLADIIATGLYESPDIDMIVDIGTNGEVVIGNRDRIMTASCAAGGAYEGYQLRCGVGAIEGAITEIQLNDGRATYKTLGDKPALGLCGSGMIDLLAELLKNDVLDQRARIEQDFRITDSVSMCQEDINHLIIAKAGLRTDQDLLLKYFGVTLDEVARVYLAGAFGNFMNIDNAMAIGLLPKTNPERFVRFGNGALAGARAMLLSQQKRRDAEALSTSIEHTKPNEIEGTEFQYIVAANMYFADPVAP